MWLYLERIQLYLKQHRDPQTTHTLSQVSEATQKSVAFLHTAIDLLKRNQGNNPIHDSLATTKPQKKPVNHLKDFSNEKLKC